jgi:hypothetical protein
VHDGYTGSSSVVGNGGDILKIPSGGANYWQAAFVFVTQIPGVGRKKVVLALSAQMRPFFAPSTRSSWFFLGPSSGLRSV